MITRIFIITSEYRFIKQTNDTKHTPHAVPFISISIFLFNVHHDSEGDVTCCGGTRVFGVQTEFEAISRVQLPGKGATYIF